MPLDEHTHPNNNTCSELLQRAISEVRSYQSPSNSPLPAAYFDSLVEHLQRTAALPPGNSLDRAIDALGRIIVDGYPLTSDFAPSIARVLDTAAP